MAKAFRDLGDDAFIDAMIDAARAGVPSNQLPAPGAKLGTWRKQKPKPIPAAELDQAPTGDATADDFKPVVVWDSKEEGLRLYIGKRAATWQYFRQSRDHGDREHTFRTLGKFDPGFVVSYSNPNPAAFEPPTHRAKWHMGCEAARRQARILAGKIEEGAGAEGTNAKTGPTFAQAFTGGFENADGDKITGYLEYLKATAKAGSKWPYNVERLGETVLLPKWGKWSLIEMGKRPTAFKEWYLGLGDNPTNANHAARVIRALYRRAAAHDHRLPPRDPVAVIGKKEWHKERKTQKAADPTKLREWYAAWKDIPNATHRAFHLVNLLIGARPGQLGVVRWRDLDLDRMKFTMPDAVKNQTDFRNDVTVPITPEIVAAFMLAKNDPERPDPDRNSNEVNKRKGNRRLGPDDLIFPGCLNNPTRDTLPARGHALRRTHKSIAQYWCGVDSDFSEWLQGRPPEGVKARYLPDWVAENGPKIIEAQRTISKTIMGLLTGKSAKGKPAKMKRAA